MAGELGGLDGAACEVYAAGVAGREGLGDAEGGFEAAGGEVDLELEQLAFHRQGAERTGGGEEARGLLAVALAEAQGGELKQDEAVVGAAVQQGGEEIGAARQVGGGAEEAGEERGSRRLGEG